jgi:hypothetical protein
VAEFKLGEQVKFRNHRLSGQLGVVVEIRPRNDRRHAGYLVVQCNERLVRVYSPYGDKLVHPGDPNAGKPFKDLWDHLKDD